MSGAKKWLWVRVGVVALGGLSGIEMTSPDTVAKSNVNWRACAVVLGAVPLMLFGRHRFPSLYFALRIHVETPLLVHQSLPNRRASPVLPSCRLCLHRGWCRRHRDASIPQCVRSTTSRVAVVYWRWRLARCSVKYESMSQEDGGGLIASPRRSPFPAPPTPDRRVRVLLFQIAE